MMPPLFIVLEALDGVGKTTLARDLAARIDGVYMDTPGPLLRELSPSVLGALGPNQLARCLFYAASVLVAGESAKRIVQRGKSVVMDRYWLSTLSYARARGVTEDLAAIEAAIPRPDATVQLILDEGERQRRLRERGLTEADRETLQEPFRAAVLAEMGVCPRVSGLGPTARVEVSGADREAAVDRVFTAIGLGS